MKTQDGNVVVVRVSTLYSRISVDETKAMLGSQTMRILPVELRRILTKKVMGECIV